MKQRLITGLLCACVALFAGCAQVPKESVELSATLGRDLLEVQRSHRRAIDLLHDRDVADVNRFLTDVAEPAYLKAAFAAVGDRMAEDLRAATAPNATPAAREKVIDQMRRISVAVAERMARQRKELIGPIEDSRKSSLQELDLAYAEMQRANAVLTAHLSSVLKVHALQDEVLAKAGLKGFREKVGDEALAANSKITEALAGSADVDKALADLKDKLAKLKK